MRDPVSKDTIAHLWPQHTHKGTSLHTCARAYTGTHSVQELSPHSSRIAAAHSPLPHQPHRTGVQKLPRKKPVLQIHLQVTGQQIRGLVSDNVNI